MRLYSELNLQAVAFKPIALHILNESDFESDVHWNVGFAEFRNGRERGYVVSIQHGFASKVVRIFFAEDRNTDRFFIWTWEDHRVHFDSPELTDASTASYKGRFTCGEFRFDLASVEFKNLVKDAKDMVAASIGKVA